MKRYEQVPHTADIAARIYGKTIPELFENAAFAMFDMAGDLKGLASKKTINIKTKAPDRESLLIAWLNELLYAASSRRMLFSEFNVKLRDNELMGEATGAQLGADITRLRKEIKAATYHDLEIRRTNAGYEITVVFDV
jgi:SHS2 domain-containing protein